ncbi:hypothetical protein D3C85_1187520 [compost metagenome]
MATVPLALDLADQPRQYFALMSEHIGEHVFGHDLTENPHGAGQTIVARQAVDQQWRDSRPGRLQPLRLVTLTQQRRQQVRLTEPDRALSGLTGQFSGVAAGQHFQFRRCLAQQLGVHRVVVFSNQNAHASNLSKTVQTAADRASLRPRDHRQNHSSVSSRL